MKNAIFVPISILLVFPLVGCGKKQTQSGQGNDISPQAQSGQSDDVGPRARVLLTLIDVNKDVIEPRRFAPPSTQDSFWFQGQGAVPFYFDNNSKGYLFDTWEQGMTPAGDGVAAFQGWLFLQPNGRAQIIYQKYHYKLNGQTIYEAYAAKIPDNYDNESRLFIGRWTVSHNTLTIQVVDTNPDPKYFNGPNDSKSFDLNNWKSATFTYEEIHQELQGEIDTAIKTNMTEFEEAFGPISAAQADVVIQNMQKAAKAMEQQEIDRRYKEYQESQRTKGQEVMSLPDFWAGHANDVGRSIVPIMKQVQFVNFLFLGFKGNGWELQTKADKYLESDQGRNAIFIRFQQKVLSYASDLEVQYPVSSGGAESKERFLMTVRYMLPVEFYKAAKKVMPDVLDEELATVEKNCRAILDDAFRDNGFVKETRNIIQQYRTVQ